MFNTSSLTQRHNLHDYIKYLFPITKQEMMIQQIVYVFGFCFVKSINLITVTLLYYWDLFFQLSVNSCSVLAAVTIRRYIYRFSYIYLLIFA